MKGQIPRMKIAYICSSHSLYEYSLFTNPSSNSSDYAWSGVLRSPANRNVGHKMEAVLPAQDFLDKSSLKLIHQTTLGLNLLRLDHLLAGLSASERDAVDALGRTSLVWAARRGDLAAVSTLLGYGAKDNIRDQWNMSALVCAIRAKSFECVALLVESGSPVREPHAYNYTPLHQCAYDSCEVEMADLLLEYGADLQAVNDNGDTPLAVAIIKGAKHIALHLIREHGANMNTANKQGITPVHSAVSRNEHHVLQEMLERDADHSTPTKAGKTLLHAAAEAADAETLKILIDTDVWDINVNARWEGRTAEELVKQRINAGPEWHRLFKVLLHGIELANADVFETASESWSLENSVLIEMEKGHSELLSKE